MVISEMSVKELFDLYEALVRDDHYSPFEPTKDVIQAKLNGLTHELVRKEIEKLIH